jgi:hypothetical protein
VCDSCGSLAHSCDAHIALFFCRTLATCNTHAQDPAGGGQRSGRASSFHGKPQTLLHRQNAQNLNFARRVSQRAVALLEPLSQPHLLACSSRFLSARARVCALCALRVTQEEFLVTPIPSEVSHPLRAVVGAEVPFFVVSAKVPDPVQGACCVVPCECHSHSALISLSSNFLCGCAACCRLAVARVSLVHFCCNHCTVFALRF